MTVKEQLMEKLRELEAAKTKAGKGKVIIHNILNSSEETRGKNEGTIKIVGKDQLDISGSILKRVFKEKETIKLFEQKIECLERALIFAQLSYKLVDENTIKIYSLSEAI